MIKLLEATTAAEVETALKQALGPTVAVGQLTPSRFVKVRSTGPVDLVGTTGLAQSSGSRTKISVCQGPVDPD